MPSQTDIRQAITNQIIEALESGTVPPWRRPWRIGNNAGSHANVVSKNTYRGLNPILLDLASETHGFSSRWGGTFNQWRQLGGRVMPRPQGIEPGKWGTQIVFWSPVSKKVENQNGDLEDDRFYVLRLYTVFNVDQVEGLDHLRAGQADTSEPVVIDYHPADQAIVATGATIRFGGNKAFYPLAPTQSKCHREKPLRVWMSSIRLAFTSFVTGQSEDSVGIARRRKTPTPSVNSSPKSDRAISAVSLECQPATT